MLIKQIKTFSCYFFLFWFLTTIFFVGSSFATEKEQIVHQEQTNISQKEANNSIIEKKEQEKFTLKEETPTPTFSWTSYFEAIGIMLILLFALWYVLKVVRKVGNGRFLPSQKLLPRDSMFLEGQLSLGQGKSIVIVRALDERLVLGVTEQQINLLTKIGMNDVSTFEELLQKNTTQDTTNN